MVEDAERRGIVEGIKREVDQLAEGPIKPSQTRLVELGIGGIMPEVVDFAVEKFGIDLASKPLISERPLNQDGTLTEEVYRTNHREILLKVERNKNWRVLPDEKYNFQRAKIIRFGSEAMAHFK